MSALALTPSGIRSRLCPGDFYRLEVREEVDSTNLRLKALAEQGEAEGAVLIAASQRAGRGRRGRSFYSPGAAGLYMSILLRPDLPVSQALTLTTKAAVAVREAIERQGISAGIKWVNDLYVSGRKVCGILTEGGAAAGTDRLKWAVVGIGVNVQSPEEGFPPQIAGIAGALYPFGAAPRYAADELAADILNAFLPLYRGAPDCHLARYRAGSLVPGRDILVLRGENALPARALAIKEDFSLLVRYADGREEALTSGEVSTKLL